MKILVVDDDRQVRDALVMMLKAAGHETTEACDGADAIALLGPAEVIVTDFQMPLLNGLQLAVKIRHKYPEKRIVMCTATDNVEKMLAAHGNPVDVLLMKGKFRMQDLLKAVVKT